MSILTVLVGTTLSLLEAGRRAFLPLQQKLDRALC